MSAEADPTLDLLELGGVATRIPLQPEIDEHLLHRRRLTLRAPIGRHRSHLRRTTVRASARYPISRRCAKKIGVTRRFGQCGQIAIMEMVSDPELGTVIDTTQMIDPDGNPLPKDIADCLRETADSLSLPPLGKQSMSTRCRQASHL